MWEVFTIVSHAKAGVYPTLRITWPCVLHVHYGDSTITCARFTGIR